LKVFKLLLWLLIVLVMVASASAALTDGIQLWYKMDEVGAPLIDSISPGTYNLTTKDGDPALHAGVVNFSVDYDGVGDDHFKNGIAGLPTGSRTWQGWINIQSWIDRGSVTADMSIWSEWGGPANWDVGWQISLDSEPKILRVSARNDTGPTVAYQHTLGAGTNYWFYLVIMFDSSNNNYSVYINGTMVNWTNSVAVNTLDVNNEIWVASSHVNRDFDGYIDEVYIWNRTLSKAEINQSYILGLGGHDLFYTPAGPLNMSEIHPYPKGQFNTNPAGPIWALINTTYNNWNCSLYLNGTLNQTQTLPNGTNVNCSFNVNLSIDHYTAFIRGQTNVSDANTSVTNIYFDNVTPTLNVINWTNYTLWDPSKKNISGSWQAADNYYLYRVSSWINGNLVDNITEINSTLYSYNLSVNATNMTVGGYNTLTIQVADGHTAKKIHQEGYGWYNGLFNDHLAFEMYEPYKRNGVYIENKKGSIWDSWSATPQKDRYTFSYAPYHPEKSIVLNITARTPITIQDNGVHTWLIFGNHWLDFKPYDTTYKRITPYVVQAIIQNPNLDKKLFFNSIGDLNIIEKNYTFVVANVTALYPDPVAEGYTESLRLKIYAPQNITNTSASLIWNGTNINVTMTNMSGYDLYTGYVTVPIINNITEVVNFTWFFNVTSAVKNLSSNITLNQTIVQIGIDNCSVYTIRAVNLSLRDYDNNSLVIGTVDGYFEVWINETGTYRPFNLTWAGNSTYGICINANRTYKTNAQLEYTATGYSIKNYYFYNTTFDNVTDAVTLWLSLNTTYVEVNVVDQDDNPLEDVYIYVQSYDLATNSYQTTEVLRTDYKGDTLAQLHLFTQWYRFLLVYEGETVLVTSPTRVVTTTLNFQINLVTNALENFNEFAGVVCNLVFNNNTNRYRFTWNNPTGGSVRADLMIYQVNAYGSTLINNSNLTSASGTLLYDLTPGNHTYQAKGYITVYTSPGTQYLCCDPVMIIFGGDHETYGLEGVFYAALVIILAVMVGIYSPVAAVVFAMLSITILRFSGLIYISNMYLICLLLFGIIAIWRMRRI